MRKAACLALLLWCCLAPAQDLAPLPEVRHRVTDTTGTLSPEQAAQLESMLAAFEQRKGSQIAIVIVPTTRPETIEEYSIRLADKVKVGRKNVDDGLIVLVAVQDRKVRIEVGSALEGPIPDSVADRIIREIIVPYFRDGDFYAGLAAACKALMKLIDGEPLPAPRPFESAHHHSSGLGDVLLPAIVFVVVVGGLLTAVMGRVAGSLATGAMTAGGAWFFTGTLLAAGLGGLLGFLFPLVLGGTVGHGRGGPGGGLPIMWGGLGGGMRSGGSFGGGSGWGGGGGGFSGGGASGDW